MAKKETKQQLTVLPNEAGKRLDAFLGTRITNQSRNQWATQIRAGEVLVDGKMAKSSHLLKRGQVVTVQLASPKPASKTPHVTLSVLHQDKDMLVINKPAGLVMHPAGRHQSGTLLDILEDKFAEAYLVHRLDKDTSGVVIVARNLNTKTYLASLFARRQIHKTYLALVVGHIKPAKAYLDLPIRRGRSGKFEIGADGRSAKSFYQVVEYLPGFSLIEVHPESGRTHQVRVHFSAIKHPVASDEMYGQKLPGLSRHFLHALKIEFVDPAGKSREFTAPLPTELNQFLNELRQK